MTLARGVLLASRYRIQKVLGRGSTGIVYRAYDVLLEQPVALKVLHEAAAARRGTIRSFRGELGLSRRIAHPNVCRVHEYVEDEGARFLVRELVEGRDLRMVLRRRGPLEPELACEIALELAQGLGAIHAAGLVHRRLTSRHVLCDASPRVRIAGLRRARTPGAAFRSRGPVTGRVEYMSPEEARGQAVDARSDLYSLGVLLFEMITGAPPFRGTTPVLTRLQHIHEPPPLSGPRSARVPLRLVGFLEKALAKSPEKRFASASEMASALRIAARPAVPMELDALPWALHEDLLDDPLVPPFASQAVRAGIALAGLAAIVVGGAWLATRVRPSAAPPATAVVGEPASPFVPAAIESPPAPSEVADAPSPAPAAPTPLASPTPAAAPTRVASGVTRPASSGPVRVARLEPRRLAPLPEEQAVVPAVLETSRVAEDAIAPEVAEVVAPDDSPGRLQIGVRPWAAVRIDDRPIGETPLAPLELAPGTHTARLDHPDYQPLVRKVTVRSGETVRLQVDLRQDGIAR
jgi:eukaryotic-like serine/threonine-protein kinase